MTLQEIFFWKTELERVSQEFRKVWKCCPKCNAEWVDIGWDAESDHEHLLVECRNEHLFRVDIDTFWLFDLDDLSLEGVYAPKEEVVADACEAK